MKLKPCPFCGNENLYTGHNDGTSMQVCCWKVDGGCGARMKEEYPVNMPKSCKTLDDVARFSLKKAATRWNRRVK